MRRLALFTMLAVLLSCILVSVQAQELTIKPGDNLNITVLGEPDLTRKVIVSPQGTITLPLVNEVRVVDMTALQATQEITKQLKRFMKNPQVSVEMAETAKIQITVSGEVKNSGIYTLPSGAKVMDAITAAGGYSPSADLSKVSISRTGGVTSTSTIDLNKFLISGDSAANVVLVQGDTIVVPSRETAVIGTITVLGAVRQPGPQPLTQGLSLREAVMAAGGPTELADPNKVTLRHENSTEQTTYSYAKAAAGDMSSNPQLAKGDVVYVGSVEQLGYYTIQGAVANPGRYEIKGSTSLTEAIAIAGGVRGRAKLNDVTILRPEEGRTKALKANVSQIMVGKVQNMMVQNGDNINVPAGGDGIDIMKYASLAVSIAWLLFRR